MSHVDWRSAASYYAPSMTIVDDDPPYTYEGSGAGDRFLANATPQVSAVDFETSAPWFETFNDGILYSVLPASAVVTLKSGPRIQKNGIYTFIVRNVEGAWKIAGMAWGATSTCNL